MESVAETKVCTKCGVAKSLAEFREFLNCNGQAKRQSWCRECKYAACREDYAKKKEMYARRVVPYEGVKTCCRCQAEKHVTDFAIARNDASGRRKHCRACAKELTQEASRKNPDKYAAIRRRANLKRCFGMTIQDYELLLASQGGGCAICGRRELDRSGRKMPVDHCHTTGVIRGVLCTNCNGGLGKFHDSIEKMEMAIQYLTTHGAKRADRA